MKAVSVQAQTPAASGAGAGQVRTQRSNTKRPVLQAKLAVNRPGDRYEQEADRLAGAVLGSFWPAAAAPVATAGIQRAGAAEPPVLTPALEGQVQALQGGGQPLPPALRSFFGPRLGHDFAAVRIHADDRAAQSARALGALAYTRGNDVVFAAGQWQPESPTGLRLLAHELVHVVQQGAALPVQVQRKHSYGVAVPDPRVERPAGFRQTVTVPPPGERPDIQRTPDGSPGTLETTGAQPVGTSGAEPVDGGQAPGALQTPPNPPAAPPAPTLTLTPGNQLVRGGNLSAAVNFTPRPGDQLTVTAWEYVTPGNGTVARPAADADFQTRWQGQMAASGQLAVSYRITPAGGQAGQVQTLRQAVTVSDRTGAPWAAATTENAEHAFGGQPSPPVLFRQLGQHDVNIALPTAATSTIAGGPNAQFQFVTGLGGGGTYTSQPLIHPDLTTSTSAFFVFHSHPGRLYLVVGTTRTLIPPAQYSNLHTGGATLTFDVPDWEAFYKARNVYEVTADGGGHHVTVRPAWWGLSANSMNAQVTITDEPALRQALGLSATQGYSFNVNPRGAWQGFELMQGAAILAGTRSHEYQHLQHSHRANFRAMMRALDPQRKIESTVASPGNAVNFGQQMQTWRTEILSAAPIHDLVDETASRTQERMVTLSSPSMAGVNQDPASGTTLGAVWNIPADRPMT